MGLLQEGRYKAWGVEGAVMVGGKHRVQTFLVHLSLGAEPCLGGFSLCTQSFGAEH